jgi:ADP-ribose pyrophosphatase YjhB (NUDIX family)
MLFIVRGKDPGKGRLAPPGGFIDLGETAEAAVHREVREEVGIELGQLKFLCSQPNQYLYGGVQYPVLDLFFTADAVSDAAPKALDDVTEVRWMHPAEVAPEALAFVSMQEAFRVLRCGS